MNAYEAEKIISKNNPNDDSELSLAMKIASISLSSCVIGGCNKECAAEELGTIAKQSGEAPNQHTQLAIAARVLLDVYDGQSDLGFVPAIYDLRAALQQQADA